MRTSAALLAAALTVAAAQLYETRMMPPVTYKVGADSDCDGNMSSTDPDADAMPHTNAPFPGLQALAPEKLEARMNAKAPKAQLPADRLYPNNDLTEKQQIPYEDPGHSTAMRRPCNLDKVLELLASIQADYAAENATDAAFSTGVFASTVDTAKRAHQLAQEAVAELEAAQTANDTLYELQAIVISKATLLHDTMLIKADMTQQEGLTKRPIVEALGRIHTELTVAIANKQAALEDFGKPPPKSEADRIRTVELHSKLISNLRHQEDLQHKLSHDLLTPIQLDLNQTDTALSSLETELKSLQDNIDNLLPIAQAYSAEALATAKAVEVDTAAHLSALLSAHRENVQEHAQRAADRSANVATLQSAIAIVKDVVAPRDAKDEYVNVTGTDTKEAADAAFKSPLPPPPQ